MQEAPQTIGLFASFTAAGYLVTRLFLNRSTSKGKKPFENAKVRFKTKEAMYRTRLIEFDNKTWTFAAPLQRNVSVPIAVGEMLTCEVMTYGGVLMFTAPVIERCNQRGALIIAAPKTPVFCNRRSEEREDVDQRVAVEGQIATLMNLSPGGAKVQIRGRNKLSDKVLVNMEEGRKVGATVVDSEDAGGCTILRLQFDEPVPSP